MTIKTELIELIERVDKSVKLPPVVRVYIPEPAPSPDKHTEFGVVVLKDGSAGLYYAWLGESQQGMGERYAGREFAGKHPMELVEYYKSDHEADCSLGLATINAITQHIFRRAGYVLNTAGDSMGTLAITPADHVGMVGYYPSLVRRLRERRIRVTVIEKKAELIEREEFIHVTLDPEQLQPCNKIISTATTLLNNSIDDILRFAGNADQFVIVGPTAGFFPDPLFGRGVTAVGGTEILDAGAAIERIQTDQGLGAAARKYIIKREEYPGMEHLLDMIRT